MKEIETPRLVLRRWKESDLYDLFDIMKSPSVLSGGFEPHTSIDASAELLSKYIESNDRWAIELKNSGKVIGCIGIVPDNNRGKLYAHSINYVLSEHYRGNGYMTEAVRRIIQYAFKELDSDLLSAFCVPENVKSKKVLERCGFEYETTIKQGYRRFDGQTFDSVCYCILKSNYMKENC